MNNTHYDWRHFVTEINISDKYFDVVTVGQKKSEVRNVTEGFACKHNLHRPIEKKLFFIYKKKKNLGVIYSVLFLVVQVEWQETGWNTNQRAEIHKGLRVDFRTVKKEGEKQQG